MLSAPAPLVAAIVAVLGLAMLLGALATIPPAYTAFRRSVRNALIAQRAEGWGSRKHPNQELIEAPPLPSVLDQVAKLRPRDSRGERTDGTSRRAA